MVEFSPRLIENKSFLQFLFPVRPNAFARAYLPMYENLKISETINANIKDYDVVGRNGNVFAYLSTKSREFKLNFNLTLPHIKEYIKGSPIKLIEDAKLFDFRSDKKKFERQEGTAQESSERSDDQFNFLLDSGEVDSEFNDLADLTNSSPVTDSIIRVYSWWVNLIRASVINNASNPIYGPPIVRMTHGFLYQGVPCIVKRVSINFDEIAGYDIEYLVNNLITVTMDLAEVRVGNFEEYEKGNIIKGDNVAGWEALLEGETMDPVVDVGTKW